MLSAYLGLLTTARNAANDWRAAATSVGVQLNQLNFVFPDGKAVVLSWDADANDWQVDTQ